MENSKDVRLSEQFKAKIKRGDFVTLGQLLDVQPEAARMQFNRNKEEAVLGMVDIIENREAFILNYALKDRSVILDCAITKGMKFLVVIQFDGKLHHNFYDTTELMKLRVADFITEVLQEVPANTKLIVTDCSIGFLPSVINAIKNFGFKQVFRHPSSSKVEALVQKLTSNN